MIKIESLDHIVITVTDMERTIGFYANVLGLEEQTFGSGRKALAFGRQRIHLHEAGENALLKAGNPVPGSADLCFLTAVPIQEVMEHIQSLGVEIEEGPVRRAGAAGVLESIYIRDPDRNLVEIANVIDS